MKKIKIAVLCITLALAVVISLYTSARKSFIEEVKSEFPELSNQTKFCYLPWPIGPKIIVNLSGKHPLYLEHTQNINEGKDGTIQRGSLKALVMSSDGTTFIEREGSIQTR